MPWPVKSYGDWESDDVLQLLEDPKPEENARRDYKLEYSLFDTDPARKDEARLKLLKDVSAMANAVGGALLLGVRQTRDPNNRQVADDLAGIPKDEVEQLRKTIANLVDTHLDVRPGPLRFWPVEVPEKVGRQVLIVEIPQNSYSLSMVTYGNVNQFWVRRGDGKRLMTTDEIQYEFARMEKVRSSAGKELDELTVHLERAESEASLICVMAVPVGRSRDSVPPFLSQINDVVTNGPYYREYTPRFQRMLPRHVLIDWATRPTPFSLLPSLRPTLRGLSTEGRGDREGRLEIWRDGTVVFGCRDPLLLETRSGQRQCSELRTIYEVLSSGLHLIKDIQQEYGISPFALARAGLFGYQNVRLVRSRQEPPGEFVLEDRTVLLDTVTLSEGWEPEAVFLEWATLLGNAVHIEEAVRVSPWMEGASPM